VPPGTLAGVSISCGVVVISFISISELRML
jgi:hypothetical protein